MNFNPSSRINVSTKYGRYKVKIRSVDGDSFGFYDLEWEKICELCEIEEGYIFLWSFIEYNSEFRLEVFDEKLVDIDDEDVKLPSG